MRFKEGEKIFWASRKRAFWLVETDNTKGKTNLQLWMRTSSEPEELNHRIKGKQGGNWGLLDLGKPFRAKGLNFDTLIQFLILC